VAGGGVVAYRRAPTVVWVKDAHQTILVKEDDGRTWCLEGVEAAVWDLLTLNYSAERTIVLLSVLLNGSRREANEYLSEKLEGWQEAGIVQVVKGSARD
jgi:hypothetical protein